MRSLLLIGLLGLTVGAAEDPSQAAARRGLDALAAQVLADDGSQSSPGIDGLCGMALLAGGHTPSRGQHHAVTARLVERLLAAQDRFSGLWHGHGGYLYDHAFATLFLADTCGESTDPRVRPALVSAIDAALRVQGMDGGFRHILPGTGDSSVTGAVIQAFRAAHDAGLDSPALDHAVLRAVDFLAAMSSADGRVGYTSPDGGQRSPQVWDLPRLVAATAGLYAADREEAGHLDRTHAMADVRRLLPTALAQGAQHHWYLMYYAAVCCHAAGPEDWRAFRDLVFPAIVARQDDDGLWRAPEHRAGGRYDTAMALIVLQIPNGYLPIMQH